MAAARRRFETFFCHSRDMSIRLMPEETRREIGRSEGNDVSRSGRRMSGREKGRETDEGGGREGGGAGEREGIRFTSRHDSNCKKTLSFETPPAQNI